MSNGKSLFYVTDEGLAKLKLNFSNGDFNISEQEEYTLEELQKQGIYVVDHSLNAAFLDNGETYGKIVNYGSDLNIADGKEINGKIVNILPTKKVVSNQEIVLMIDRTVSMGMYVTAQPSGSRNDCIPLIMENGIIKVEEGYNKTRWAETVKAMDSFIDSFLPEKNELKKLTIFTYYGQNADSLSVEYLGTFTNATAAKNSYANIFTIDQYERLAYNIVNNSSIRSTLRRQNSSYLYTKTSGGWNNTVIGYDIDCRVLNPNYSFLYTNGTDSNIDCPTLGYGTCTPIALKKAYEYIQDAMVDNIPKDFLIMSDGDANISINYTQNQATITQEITHYAGLLMDTYIKDRNVEVFAVGFSPDAINFNSYFGGHITEYFTATQVGELASSFEAVYEKVNENARTSFTTGKIRDEYSNIVEIRIEVLNSHNTSMKRIFLYTDTGPYDLSTIYANQMINLKEAFDLIDNDNSITSEYDTINVHILYTVPEEEDSDDI